MKRSRDAVKTKDEVLVAIINNLLDFAVARDQHWYRIPVRSVENLLKKRWPPQWLAFYLTKVFGSEAYAVNYYARVLAIRKVFRWQLFPEQPHEALLQKWLLFQKSVVGQFGFLLTHPGVTTIACLVFRTHINSSCLDNMSHTYAFKVWQFNFTAS